MSKGFDHRLDPVLFELWGIQGYWYGLGYALGFLGIHLWFVYRRRALGWRLSEVYDFSLIFIVSVLLCGRAFSVFVYQWGYYQAHLDELFSYWRGGMASHGLLLGGLLGVWLFSRLRRKPFLQVADALVVPGALFLAFGRIGNFINGQIVGAPTEAWWGVRFPGFDELRHPVTLYESLKNFALIPILLWVSARRGVGRGFVLAHFVFWYGFLRLFADLFRDYGGTFLGIGKGQYFNLLMAGFGLVLLAVFAHRARTRPTRPPSRCPTTTG